MLAASGALDADYAGKKINNIDSEIASTGRPRDESGQVVLSDVASSNTIVSLFVSSTNTSTIEFV